MIEQTRTIYRCDHCKKVYLTKKYCLKHEDACKHNPNNDRICLTGCVSLVKRVGVVTNYTYYGGETEWKASCLFCKVRDCFVYPPKVERKQNAIEFDDYTNEPMRKECEQYKHYSDEIEESMAF